MALTEEILRKKFGYNDPNFINSILSGREPELAARLERESQPAPVPTPAPIQPVADFQAEQRARMGAFTTKLGEVPEQLTAVRTALKLPEAYETYGQAGKTARDIGYTMEDMPQAVQQALSGRGVSAGQITGRSAAEIRGLQPALTAASRGLESAGSTLQGLLSQYQTEKADIFTPLQIEGTLISAQSANEYDLMKTQITSALNREITQMQETGATDRANIARAVEMAKLEDKYGGISFQDLGTQLGIFKGTELVGTQPITKFGSTDTGW